MRKLYLLLIAALAFAACEKKVAEESVGLSLLGDQASELSFEGWADSKTVSFQAPVNWMVMMDESIEWFKVSPLYGEAGEKSITVEVFDYDGEGTLEGSFDIVAGDDKLTIGVSQMSSTDPNSEYIYIKDDKFNAFLVSKYDTNGNGRLEKSEAAVVESIVCNDLEVESIEGIKSFTSLKSLDCSYNTIKGELDLSGMESLEEAYVDHNIYSKLNLAGCSNLKIVEANDNVEHTADYQSIFHLTEVDLTGCGELLYLELTDNAIADIDLKDCAKLQVLRMTWNDLRTIDVTANPDLTHIYVRKNPELAGIIDLSANTKLVEVWCAESKVEGLNLANEHAALTTIISYYSSIASLDLSTCPNLKTLEAHGMQLTAIDLTKCTKLDYLWLKFNAITELDLTQCPDVREVQVGYNQISTLDMSKCPNIKLLEASSNLLTEVNLDGCVELESLDLSMNQLDEVDLSDCAKLFSASVSENKLTKLDVSNKPELVVLSCSLNSIADLNIEGCDNLRWLYADNNKLTALDLRANSALEELALTNNELHTLLVSGLKSLSLCEFNRNKLERLDLSGCSAVYELYVHDNPLAYFSLYDCASLYQLDMRRTAMKSVDLSNNKNAAFLFAEENPQLETIYIHPEASFSTISYDEHVKVYLYDAEDHNDVNNGNWGDEDIDPWTAA